jgi:multidrug transporter EmrE-like cation transporter
MIRKYVILCIATFFAILPVMFIKKYIQTNDISYLFGTISTYIFLMIAYMKLLELGSVEVSSVYTLLQIMQIIAAFLVGILYFKEKIYTNKLIGTGLGIAAIYFLVK